MFKRLLKISIVLLLLAGCNKEDDPVIEPEQTPETADRYDYIFDPHVIADEYVEIYGESFKDHYFSFCDAILNAQDSFICTSMEEFHTMMTVSRSCLPLATFLVDTDNVYVKDQKGYLSYKYEKDELPDLISSFIDKVTTSITTAVPYEVPDHLKAMQLLTYVAKKDAFDYEHDLDDMLDTNAYRAIMKDIGICQEIAGEYIYYLLQTGIDAIICSSLNSDKSEAHEWALVKLDGRYYHCDPTYTIEYPDSLYFFGMNDIQRSYYGDFPTDYFSYGDSDLLTYEQFKADDDRFKVFWLTESYEIDYLKRLIITKEINTGIINEITFE